MGARAENRRVAQMERQMGYRSGTPGRDFYEGGTMDVIQIAQAVGDRAYERESDQYEASRAYTVNTQAALAALHAREDNGGNGKHPAEMMYAGLVEAGEDAVEAAWQAAEMCGLKDAPHFDIGELPDPMAVDWEALGSEPVTSQYRDAAESAEGPAVQ